MKPSLALILSFFISTSVLGAHYEIDSSHSNVGFKVRHVVSKVPGKFNDFKGSIDYDPAKPKDSKVTAEIQAASIDTNHKKRDEHLRSPDFFDAKKFPTIKFESKEVVSASGESLKLKGELTMHGVTKPVILDVTINGTGKDPWGNSKAGFTAVTKVNRKDFGIVWNKALDSGGLLLGDEVEITLEVEADQKKG